MRARKNTASPRHTFQNTKAASSPCHGGRPGGDHRHRDIGQLSFVDDKLGSAKKPYRQPYPTGSGPRCRSTAGIPDTSFCPGDSPSSTGIHTIRPAERSKPVSASTPSRLRRNWSNRITGKRRRTHLRNVTRVVNVNSHLASGRVQQHLLLQFCFADREKQGLSALYEKQENQ